MPFDEFLKLTTTIRALYDKATAVQFFEKNVGQFYNLGSFDKNACDFIELDL